jgi:hypothetical protein
VPATSVAPCADGEAAPSLKQRCSRARVRHAPYYPSSHPAPPRRTRRHHAQHLPCHPPRAHQRPLLPLCQPLRPWGAAVLPGQRALLQLLQLPRRLHLLLRLLPGRHPGLLQPGRPAGLHRLPAGAGLGALPAHAAADAG